MFTLINPIHFSHASDYEPLINAYYNHELPDYFTNHIRWLEFRNELNKNNPSAALDVIKQLEESRNAMFFHKKGFIELAYFYLNHNDYKSVKAMIGHLLSLKSMDSLYPHVLKLIVYEDLVKGDMDTTLKRYGDLIMNYPEMDDEGEIFQQILKRYQVRAAIQDTLLTPESHFFYLKNLFRIKAYNLAERQAKYILDFYPQFSHLGEVYLILGLTYYRQYKYQHALQALFQVPMLNGYPELSNKAYYYITRIYEQSRETANAYQMHQAIVAKRGDNLYRPYSLRYLCHYYRINGPYKAYKACYSQFSEEFKDTYNYARYLWEVRWGVLESSLNMNGKQVKQAFDNLGMSLSLKNALISWQKVFFNRYEQPYSQGEGLRQFPLNYSVYSLLENYYQNHELKKDKQARIAVFARYNSLYEKGLGELALEELAYFRSLKLPEEKAYLYSQAEIRRLMGDHEKALALIEQGLDEEDIDEGSVEAPFIRFLYPRAYWKDIQKAAQRFKVDPYLILAVIKESSGFINISNESSAGLMQIAPDTAKDIAYRLGKVYEGPEMLLDIKTNIQFGAFYLSWLSEIFKNNIAYVISGYIAGPSATRMWMKSISSTDTKDFLTRVPYAETRHRIQTILDSFIIYKTLYTQ
ncbi:transglycosylase SLT domain-containing protein [Thermoproteota archaeon]